jgi:hypothetical protein
VDEPDTGVATVSIIGNAGKQVCGAAYVGEWPNLRLISSYINSTLITIKFPAPGGQRISIQVARGTGSSFVNPPTDTAAWTVALQTDGSVVEGLNVQNAATVESDEFAHAITLTGELASGVSYPAWSEQSPIDPIEAGVNNNWYSWTAPHSGTARVTCATPWPIPGSADLKAFGVYSGPDLPHLSKVAAANGAGTTFASFEAIGGQTYYIGVGKQTANTAIGWIITTVTQEPRTFVPLAIERAIRLRIESQAGKWYQLQDSADLKRWANVGATLLGTGQPDWLYSPTTVVSPKFYRIIEIGGTGR